MHLPKPLDPAQALIGVSLLENILVPERETLTGDLLNQIREHGATKQDMGEMFFHLLYAAIVIVQDAAHETGSDTADVLDRTRTLLTTALLNQGTA